MINSNNSNGISISKKELRAMLLLKLSTLQYDLIRVPEEARRYLLDIRKTKNDKYKAMDVYAEDNSPVKVTDLSGLPKRACDMTGEMIDFSEGFDRYILSIEKEYAAAKRRRSEAIRLLTMVMSLKQPYSRILYLRYYRKMSPEDACYELHVSRSTMFRKQNVALDRLAEMFAANYGYIIKPDK
jgi:DNA-directed RNA polymerase specialized sigma24 family protein